MANQWDDDLLRLKKALQLVQDAEIPRSPPQGTPAAVNPTLQLLPMDWSGLSELLKSPEPAITPEKKEEFIVLYRYPDDGDIFYYAADNNILLALKILSEELDHEQVAETAGVTVGQVDAVIEDACRRGVVLRPLTALQRTANHLPAAGKESWERYLSSNIFTLQWHVTQACDLHCKHCYDRSNISPLTLAQGITILDQFRDFILAKNISGQVTFTGGNPLLYNNFTELYQEAAKRNFTTAILGNPTTKEVIQTLQAIQPLSFYQVSLEGLAEHNDSIRGEGHFNRIIEFLEILNELSVYSMVMLTLTQENMDQVLPLAEFLRGKTDLFTFNRLSQTGEGAALQTAAQEQYKHFLEEYLAAAENNPTMSVKDNLINIIKNDRGEELFGGCTGYGCGAAFNFCSILPNGDMHACRKFQSPIGNILRSSLLELYDSPAAEKYRNSPEECKGCAIRPVCGGCQAVIQSSGLDISLHKDPYCFMAS